MTAQDASGGQPFELIDTLETSGARAVCPFNIHTDNYLAVPQLAYDVPDTSADMTKGNCNTDCMIYKQKSGKKGEYELYQRIPASAGEDAEYFTFDGRQFLAISSLRSGDSLITYQMNTMSTIFEWNITEAKFAPFQAIPTFAAKQWRYFEIGKRRFLALAQGVAHQLTEPNPHASAIFEWNGEKFVKFQEIPSAWGYNYVFFVIDGTSYLGYADNTTPSILMYWTGMEFKQVQTFYGKSGRAFQFLEIEGSKYLAVACLHDDSILYKWTNNRFEIHQKLSGASGREYTSFVLNGEIYLIQVNFLTGPREAPKTDQQSLIFRWDNGLFVLEDTFLTFGATDVKIISVGDEVIIAVSESLTKDVRFRQASHIYKFKQKALKSMYSHLYQNPELCGLFAAYTGRDDPEQTTGKRYASKAAIRRANDPLLVATATDMVLFPGHGKPPSFKGFRLHNNGFKEICAISHVGPFMASIVNMHMLEPESDEWRFDAERYLRVCEAARTANSTELWRDKIAVEAWTGREHLISSLTDYTLAITIRYLRLVLEDPSKLNPEFFRAAYLEATDGTLGATIPINHVMIATFYLAAMETTWRVSRWMGQHKVDFDKLQVLVVGKQGRPTAGITFETSSVCAMIYGATNNQACRENFVLAPHAPSFSIANQEDLDRLPSLEAPMRGLWSYIRAVAELCPTMYDGYPSWSAGGYEPPEITTSTTSLSNMPRVKGPDDWLALTTRLRLVMEDPRQLLSGCVGDYAAEALRTHNNDYSKVIVPGLDGYEYPVGLSTSSHTISRPIAKYTESARTFLNSILLRKTETKLNGHPVTTAALKKGSLHSCRTPSALDFVDTEFQPFYKYLALPDGGSLTYWEDGLVTGPPVLWLHGLPLDSRSWEAQRRYFDTLTRNIFLDIRGYGQSSKLPPNTLPNVTALYCADITSLLDHLDLHSLTIIGFASAGHIALRLASQLGSRVTKLVTINGSPKFRRSEPDWMFGFVDSGIRHLTQHADDGIEPFTRQLMEPSLVFRDLSPTDGERLYKWFASMSYNAGVDTLLGFFNGISYDDDRALLGDITADTLVISSLLGQEVPSQVGNYLRERIGLKKEGGRKARLVELAGADHFAFATRARVINCLLEDFLFAGEHVKEYTNAK